MRFFFFLEATARGINSRARIAYRFVFIIIRKIINFYYYTKNNNQVARDKLAHCKTRSAHFFFLYLFFFFFVTSRQREFEILSRSGLRASASVMQFPSWRCAARLTYGDKTISYRARNTGTVVVKVFARLSYAYAKIPTSSSTNARVSFDASHR